MALQAHSYDFSKVPKTGLQRSSFDRSCTHTTTMDSGYLIPFFWDEALPGDTFDIRSKLFARMLTPIVPFMDNLYLETQFFFCPTRILWSNWKKFLGEKKNPDDSIDFLTPIITSPSGGFARHSIFDYMGCPTDLPEGRTVDVLAFPFLAYLKIYDDWYRAEFLQDSVYKEELYGDGPFSAADFPLLRRGKRHDYFTSANPWPQAGDSVDLPLGDYAKIQVGRSPYDHQVNSNAGTQITQMFLDPDVRYDAMFAGLQDGAANPYAIAGYVEEDGSAYHWFPTNKRFGLYADLSNATAASVNQLRQAFQMQRLLEAFARGGTRYAEIIRSIFNVDVGDARLQRPEYLGGQSTRITVNSVAQTSSTDTTSPQGNLSAYALAGDDQFICTKSFREHGYVIGLCSIRADLTYQQGLARELSRRTRHDFYWPQYAHLGEQTILNKEIYAQGKELLNDIGDPVDDQVFGYQERFAEYRYKPNRITGKLRSTDPQSLDIWHLAQKFEELPTLSPEFIEENPPVDRVIAVQNEPQFKLDSLVDLKCTRPMPVNSVPGLMDHF